MNIVLEGQYSSVNTVLEETMLIKGGMGGTTVSTTKICKRENSVREKDLAGFFCKWTFPARC